MNFFERRYFLIACIFLCLIALSNATYFVITAEATEKPPVAHCAKMPPLVSMTLKNTSFRQVSSLVEEKTRFRVKLQSINPNERVSGQFIEADIETIYTNLLRRHNLLILTDTKQCVITVKSLGPKIVNRKSDGPLDGGMDKVSSEEIPLKDTEEDASVLEKSGVSDERDPFTGMTSADIDALHKKQAAEIEHDQQNPESIDIFTGMTNAEIRALHEEQIKEITGTQP